VVALFEAAERARAQSAASHKRTGLVGKLVREFCDKVLPQGSNAQPVEDYFEVLRLLLPQVRPRLLFPGLRLRVAQRRIIYGMVRWLKGVSVISTDEYTVVKFL
jgi:hypothetical protein